MAESDTINGIEVLDDLIATLNGASATGSPKAQRIKVGFGVDGVFQDVDPAHGLPVRPIDGTYGYAAGAAAASVDVPTLARIKRVSVLAGVSAGATVTILGGDTITIPAGCSFDEQLPGDATAGFGSTEVIIGGTAQAYYVSWVA
jgi:hypothetical protein